MKRTALIVTIPIIIITTAGGAYFFIIHSKRTPSTGNNNSAPVNASQAPATTAESANTSKTAQTETTTPAKQTNTFNKTRYSTTDSSSLWVIVNKKHPISTSYAPASLVVPSVPLRLSASAEQMQASSVMSPHLVELFAAAKKDGVTLKLSSGYRSAALQKQLYDNYVARDGQAAADTYSARPGTSEHQTGLAADIMTMGGNCALDVCFANTPEGKWLAAHAHEYGFIIRYPKGKESITGYQYEPWHLRYVGKDLAAELGRTGQSMEEFFNF